MVGKILDKRYVVLEEVGQDGPGIRYLVYDMNTLQRMHLRVEPEPDGQLTGDTYQVVDMEAPLAPAASPPAAKGGGKPDIRLVSKTPGDRPRRPTPRGFETSKAKPKTRPSVEEPGTVRIPRAAVDATAPAPKTPETPSTGDKTELEESPLEAAIERALDAESTGGKDLFNTTQPIDLASAEEIAEDPPDTSRSSGERPRIQTKVLEAAWFAQGDQMEEDEPPPAEEADDRHVDHDELERQAAQLSADEYRKYALDLPPPSPPPLKIVQAFLDAKPDLATLIGEPGPGANPVAEAPDAEAEPVAETPPRSLSPAVGSPVSKAPATAAPAPEPPPAEPPAAKPRPLAPKLAAPAPAPEPEPAPPAPAAPEPPPPAVEPSPPSKADSLPPLSALLPDLKPPAPAPPPAPDPPAAAPPAPAALEPAPLPDPVPEPVAAPGASSVALDPTLLAKQDELAPPPVQPATPPVLTRPPWAGASSRSPTSGPAQQLQDLVIGSRVGTFVLGLVVGGLLAGVTTCLVMPGPTVPPPAPTVVRPAERPAAPPPVAKKAAPPPSPAPTIEPAPPEPPAAPKVHLSSKQRKRVHHYVYMARRSARRHNWKRARFFARKALRIDPSNRRASQIKTHAEQRLGIN